MALNTASLNAAASAFAAGWPYLALHSTGPVSSSTSECTSARVAATWGAPANGVVTSAANLAFTGVAASGPVVRVGYWSLATGGTYGGGCLVTGDQSANAAGAYTVTSVTETGTAV